jgi:hypothetical protein
MGASAARRRHRSASIAVAAEALAKYAIAMILNVAKY